METFKINVDIGKFENLVDAQEYFLDNAASFAVEIYEHTETGENDE